MCFVLSCYLDLLTCTLVTLTLLWSLTTRRWSFIQSFNQSITTLSLVGSQLHSATSLALPCPCLYPCLSGACCPKTGPSSPLLAEAPGHYVAVKWAKVAAQLPSFCRPSLRCAAQYNPYSLTTLPATANPTDILDQYINLASSFLRPLSLPHHHPSCQASPRVHRLLHTAVFVHLTLRLAIPRLDQFVFNHFIKPPVELV